MVSGAAVPFSRSSPLVPTTVAASAAETANALTRSARSVALAMVVRDMCPPHRGATPPLTRRGRAAGCIPFRLEVDVLAVAVDAVDPVGPDVVGAGAARDGVLLAVARVDEVVAGAAVDRV